MVVTTNIGEMIVVVLKNHLREAGSGVIFSLTIRYRVKTTVLEFDGFPEKMTSVLILNDRFVRRLHDACYNSWFIDNEVENYQETLKLPSPHFLFQSQQ